MDVYGLIGRPVSHSLSPAMFTAAFDAAGIEAVYAAFEVAEGELSAAVRGAAALGIDGLNVTIPHKEAVLELAEPTEAAAAIGAANVLAFGDGRPRADNTDAAAMTAVLDGLDRSAGHALVLGAGGAARAYVHALAAAGWSVAVANRTESRAADLVADYPAAAAHPLAAAPSLAVDADLVLNATPVGLASDERILPAEALSADHVVVDAVYRPATTRLLADAEAVGATTVSGLVLLLEQAVASFRCWRTEAPPRAAMAAALGRPDAG